MLKDQLEIANKKYLNYLLYQVYSFRIKILRRLQEQQMLIGQKEKILLAINLVKQHKALKQTIVNIFFKHLLFRLSILLIKASCQVLIYEIKLLYLKSKMILSLIQQFFHFIFAKIYDLFITKNLTLATYQYFFSNNDLPGSILDIGVGTGLPLLTVS